MATVTQFWAPHADNDELYQDFGTVDWSWALGDNSFYWGYAVRPKSANTQVEVTRQWTTSDNDINQVEHFTVTVSQPIGREFRQAGRGGFLQFTAIKVEA
jgi:hypothetical protein